MKKPVGRQRPGRLGESLVRNGVITEAQLSLALKEQERTGGRLGEILIALGFASNEEISSSLARQSGVDEVDLRGIQIPPAARQLLSEAFCRDKKVLPLAVEGGRVRLAMANTFDVLAVDEVARRTQCAIEVVAAPEPALLEALQRAYSGDEPERREALISAAEEAVARKGGIEGVVGDQPIVRLVEALLGEGVRSGATDLHLEPEERLVRCRYRVDGMLAQSATLPKSLHSAVVARVKVLAGLDISETRLPQDGKIVARIHGRHINLRISTMPTVHGENLVVRILDRNQLALGLGELGFSPPNLEAFAEAIHRPSGIILVTGPTGSGKTTTLYAALSEINALERKIATLEDPVEYELPIIRQAQVNLSAGLTFGVGLRALLRQDPDVILVGEMRDRETAEVALRAALTGHLVLSTLHTNSAAGAIPRLLDMGIAPYLLGNTLVAVVAQRLVRRLCTQCREPERDPDPDPLAVLGLAPGPGLALHRPVGCPHCRGTGYRGRRAVSEVLRVSPAIAAQIAERAEGAELTATAREEGMRILLDDVQAMVAAGETSLEEAVRHAWSVASSPAREARKEA